VFERGLLDTCVQQLEEIFSLASTKFHSSNNMIDVGAYDIKCGILKQEKIMWNLYLLVSDKLEQISIFFISWNLISSL
jgi:hypothetical protein